MWNYCVMTCWSGEFNIFHSQQGHRIKNKQRNKWGGCFHLNPKQRPQNCQCTVRCSCYLIHIIYDGTVNWNIPNFCVFLCPWRILSCNWNDCTPLKSLSITHKCTTPFFSLFFFIFVSLEAQFITLLVTRSLVISTFRAVCELYCGVWITYW